MFVYKRYTSVPSRDVGDFEKVNRMQNRAEVEEEKIDIKTAKKW